MRSRSSSSRRSTDPDHFGGAAIPARAGTAEAYGRSDAQIGERFLDALISKDRDTLLDLFAPRARFRAMALDRRWDSQDPVEIVDDILLGDFFSPDVQIDKLVSASFGTVVDVNSASYYLQMRQGEQVLQCQQHLFFDLEGGRICGLHLSCSGFLAVPATDRPA